LEKLDVLVCQIGQPGFWPMCNAMVYSIEPSLAKLDTPVSETGGSKISRTSDKLSETMMANPNDWRTLLVRYLENPGHIAGRKV
jgi:hypothetical protein